MDTTEHYAGDPNRHIKHKLGPAARRLIDALARPGNKPLRMAQGIIYGGHVGNTVQWFTDELRPIKAMSYLLPLVSVSGARHNMLTISGGTYAALGLELAEQISPFHRVIYDLRQATPVRLPSGITYANRYQLQSVNLNSAVLMLGSLKTLDHARIRPLVSQCMPTWHD